MPRAAKSAARDSAAAARTDPLRPRSGRSKPKQEPDAAAAADAAASTNQVAPSLDQNEKRSIERKVETEPNYLVLVRMVLSFDPTITRLLSLPPHLTLDKFHHVLQIAFGWAYCHAHSFTVTLSEEKNPYPRPVAYFEPMMNDIEPDLGYIRLEESEFTVHDIFSHDFFSHDVFLNSKWEDFKVTPKMELGLEYEYDHGDGWTHQITLLGRADPGLHRALGGSDHKGVLCLSGEGHPCAEDCGSEPGWQHLKEIFTKPRKKDPDDLKGWYKSVCANGDPEGLNPWKWDILEVNDQLVKLKV